MDKLIHESIISDVREKSEKANPFPGLRPFSMNESHLFFGREGQSEEVLLKLSKSHFVAIIGPSGSGKSSFIHCGLIPILFGGYVESVGTDWNIVHTRPGISPIDNLTDALLQIDASYTELTPEDQIARKTYFSTLLRSNSSGLVEAVAQHTSSSGNYLILVDQFEEIFRFKKNEEHTGLTSECVAYINLLVDAVASKAASVFVVVAMRSDFIGECAHFSNLTEAINTSSYLIPQMTYEQKRMAVIGPVAVGGGEIAPELVNRLLEDLGDNPDQLPILQHALMRTWNHWRAVREPDEPIKIHHYEAIGCMEEALSQHANEAYDELTETQKRVCEILFKSVTEKGNDAYGTRRPTKIKEIAAIAGVHENEVIAVSEAFRQPGRALLTPLSSIPLYPDTVIDISHESLMRIWIRLKNWVAEEAEAVQMYLKLAEAAGKYQIGQAGLWRPPDLQLALNWKAKQKPTLHWAQRYDPAFERVIAFLEYSKKAYEIEQTTKEVLQKRSLWRARIVALILGLFAIVSVGFLIFAITQQVKAREQAELAKFNEQQAKKQTQLALISERNAKNQRLFAEQERGRAQTQEKLARQSAIIAELERVKAKASEKEAKTQHQIALEQQIRAETNEVKAIEQQYIAIRERNNAYSLRLLSVAQAMAVKSLQITDAEQKILVAQQAYLFNRDNGGKEDDPYIYDGLYYATKKTKDNSFDNLTGHTDLVRTLVASSVGNYVYSAGSDGKIMRFDAGNLQKGGTVVSQNAGVINRALALSSDNQLLACVGEMPYIQIFNVNKPGSAPQQLKIPTKQGWFLSFAKDNKGLIFSDSTTIYYGFDQFQPIFNAKSRINTIALNPAGNIIATGNKAAQVILVDIENNKSDILYNGILPITAIAYSSDGRLLAAGDQSGTVTVWNMESKLLIATLRGHTARVNNIRFSWDNKKLATGSWDKTVRIWNTLHVDNQPIVLKDYNTDWVWSIAFSSDGEKLLAGCKDKFIRVWPTNAGLMAKKICEKISRNMSAKEWEQFVADDIPYEKTCTALPPKEPDNDK